MRQEANLTLHIRRRDVAAAAAATLLLLLFLIGQIYV
jgi:hypothetical protein